MAGDNDGRAPHPSETTRGARAAAAADAGATEEESGGAAVAGGRNDGCNHMGDRIRISQRSAAHGLA